MPYIDPEIRTVYDSGVGDLASALCFIMDPLVRAGEANYVITTLLLKAFPERRYGIMALVDGILAGVSKEYYEKHVRPYEEEKIMENGDLPW